MTTFNSCTKCVGSSAVRLIATQFSGHGCMDDLTIERSFDKQTTWVIDVLGLLLLTCYPWLFRTRHWQTPGRVVQEVIVCTVHVGSQGKPTPITKSLSTSTLSHTYQKPCLNPAVVRSSQPSNQTHEVQTSMKCIYVSRKVTKPFKKLKGKRRK